MSVLILNYFLYSFFLSVPCPPDIQVFDGVAIFKPKCSEKIIAFYVILVRDSETLVNVTKPANEPYIILKDHNIPPGSGTLKIKVNSHQIAYNVVRIEYTQYFIYMIIITSKCSLRPCMLHCTLSPAINGGAQCLCLWCIHYYSL